MNHKNKYDESVYDEPQCEEFYLEDNLYQIVRPIVDEDYLSVNEWGEW